VIAAARHFRMSPAGREAICAPGEVASVAADYTASQQYWGKITSSPPRRLSREEIALAAFRLGVSPATARRAIELGLFK
jgi:hypothetical protein